MRQRPGQLRQVYHDLTRLERHELHRPARDILLRQPVHDTVQMCSCPNQYRHRMSALGVTQQSLFGKLYCDGLGYRTWIASLVTLLSLKRPDRMKLHAQSIDAIIERDGIRIADGPQARMIFFWKYGPAGCIDPLDQVGLRAKIVFQLQWCKGNFPQAMFLDGQEQPHFSLAET